MITKWDSHVFMLLSKCGQYCTRIHCVQQQQNRCTFAFCCACYAHFQASHKVRLVLHLHSDHLDAHFFHASCKVWLILFALTLCKKLAIRESFCCACYANDHLDLTFFFFLLFFYFLFRLHFQPKMLNFSPQNESRNLSKRKLGEIIASAEAAFCHPVYIYFFHIR